MTTFSAFARPRIAVVQRLKQSSSRASGIAQWSTQIIVSEKAAARSIRSSKCWIRVSMHETRLCSPQVFEARAPGAVHKVASIAEISDATNVGILHLSIKHLCGVRIGKMAFGDDAMRITGFVGESLKPLRLVYRVRNAERRLNVNRFRHVREADLGDIILDPIVLRLESVDIAEKAVDGGRLEPRIPQLPDASYHAGESGCQRGVFRPLRRSLQQGLSLSQPFSTGSA